MSPKRLLLPGALKSIHTFETHKGDVNSCAFLDNGNWLVSGSDDKTVCFNGPIRDYIR